MAKRPGIRQRRRAAAQKQQLSYATGRIRRFRRKVLGSDVKAFVEKTQLTSVSVASGGTTFGIFTYKMTDIINWVHYSGLFDCYKLLGVKLTLVPLGSSSDVNNGTLNTSGQQGSLPMLYIAPNRDYLVPAATSTADIINDDGAKIIRFNKPVSFYLRNPKPWLKDAAGTTLALQTNLGTNFWLSTGGNSQTVDQSVTEHFGHRYGITNNAPGEMVVQVYAKYYFMLKEQD